MSNQTVDYSALLQDEDNLDPSPSEPLEIVLPKDQDGECKELTCEYPLCIQPLCDQII